MKQATITIPDNCELVKEGCYAKCDNCGFLLESEVSWIGCKSEKEHDKKCVEHLTKLLKEE